MSPSPSDDSVNNKKKKKNMVERKDIIRGMIPTNNSPIKVRCLNGENAPISKRTNSQLLERNKKVLITPDDYSNVSFLFGKPGEKQPGSLKVKNRNMSLGYNSFYSSEKYHIIN